MQLKFHKSLLLILIFLFDSLLIFSQGLSKEFKYAQTGLGPASALRMLEVDDKVIIQFQSDSIVLFDIEKHNLDSLYSDIGNKTNFFITDGSLGSAEMTLIQHKNGFSAPAITHLDYNLDTLWHLPLDWNYNKLWSYDMVQDEQGDFYITGFYEDYSLDDSKRPFIQKVSADGEELWVQKYPVIDPEYDQLPQMAHSIMLTNDDRICVMCASPTAKSVIFWTNLDGDLLEFKSGPDWDPIVLPQIDASRTTLLDQENGDIYYGLTIEGVRVVKINAQGDLLWDTQIIEKPENGNSSEFYESNSTMGAQKIIELADGNLMVFGHPDQSEWQYSMSKITSDGDVIYTRLIGPCCDYIKYKWGEILDSYSLLNFIELESGEIILAGQLKYDTDDFHKLLVMKFNADMECSEEALFDYSIEQDSIVQFDNVSSGAEFHYWDFGDGDTSTQHSPQHYYQADSIYQACLFVQGLCGADTLCQEINLKTVSNEFTQQDAVAPIQWNSERQELIHQGHELIEVDLYDLNGRLIHQLEMNPGERFVLPFRGLCFVSYLSEGVRWSRKILMH